MSGQLYCLVGDSNVKRNMTPTSCRDHLMSAAQVVLCTRFELLDQSLRSVKKDVDVCILSCLSNFVSSTEATDSIAHRVGPLFDDVFARVAQDCDANLARKYLVCPPMYRQSPQWYRDGMPEILGKFSTISKLYSRPNLALLPSFPSPELEKDGVHLTLYSGLEFVLHLFDSAKAMLASFEASTDQRQVVMSESARLLEDRVVALEQDHRRLSSEVDLKTAIKAESDDVTINERNLNSFIISGLARVEGRMSSKDWQLKAQEDVQKVITLMMGSSLPIVVVHNSSGPSPSSTVTYSVEMSSVDDAKRIRAKFGTYFRGGKDMRPAELSKVSVQNLVTRETRIRISIMKLIAKRYLARNPGAQAQVIGYLPRPLLKITPPPEAKNKRIMSYNYIEAIKKFPTNFELSEIQEITNRAAQRFSGQLRSLFVVLSDDQVQTRQRSKRPASPSGSSSVGRRARVAPAQDQDQLDDEFAPDA